MEGTMTITRALVAFSSAVVLTGMVLSLPALAQQRGSREEAKAMLTKAVASLKADRAKTLDLINKGEGGFLDRDLYPYCINASDGTIVAAGSPVGRANIGKDVRTLKDATGKAFGVEIFNAIQKPEGEITEIEYMFPKPSDPNPASKVAFVTRVGDLGCGSGYYK
jgi:hypothetical protein